MPRGKPSVSKEVKEQILKRIRDDGIPVAQIAEEHGLHSKTIYQWLSKGLSKQPSILAMAKLRRENQALKDIDDARVVGWSLLANHSVELTLSALIDAIEQHGRPFLLRLP